MAIESEGVIVAPGGIIRLLDPDRSHDLAAQADAEHLAASDGFQEHLLRKSRWPLADNAAFFSHPGRGLRENIQNNLKICFSGSHEPGFAHRMHYGSDARSSPSRCSR